MGGKQGKGSRGHGFLRGALVLTAGMAVVKVLGALFKVPLTYVVGEYGIGMFNMAYHFYGPVFSLATAGFPIAVARLVSQEASLGRWNDARQVKRVALPLFLAFGTGGALVMTCFAPLYCQGVAGAAYALAPMMALAPAVVFSSAASVYRGYYEGLGNMVPTALSQVLEALLKLGMGLFAAGWVISLCREEYAAQRTVLGLAPPTQEEAQFFILALGAAGAVLGVTAGTLVSLLYLVLRFRLHGDGTVPRLYKSSPAPKSKGKTRRLLLKITLPVALGSAASSVAGLIDATFLQNRIAVALEQFPQRFFAACQGKVPTAYWETPQAIPTYLYGCYSLAMTVYLLVPGITQAFGTSALPGVTSAWARGSKRELRGRMEAVVRVTSLFCFPAGLSLTALAEPVAGLLYGEGPSTAAIAQSLALLGLASLPAAMSGPLSSMLQAVGRADLPVKLLLLAMAVKLGANWVLCGIPEVNILGAGVGTCLCYLVLTLTQFWKLRRASGVGLSTVGVFLRPFCCALLCAASARLGYEGCRPLWPHGALGEALALGAGAALGCAAYLAGLLLLRGIRKSDLQSLPKGQKIAKMLEKQGWI